MDENKETPEEKEEKPEETVSTGDTEDRKLPDKATGRSPIDKANDAAERLETANKVTAELVKKQEELAVVAKLSGTTEAGIAPAAPKEETPKEYKDRVMAGNV